MPSFHDLSGELASSIIDKIYEEAHPAPALKMVSLVCRVFYEISSALLFRHVNIPLAAKDAKQCTAFLQFLHKEPKIRSRIQDITISVPRYGDHGRHRDLEESFKILLPLLPKLKAIRIGDDVCFNHDWIDLRPIDPSIMSTIDELHRSVSLAVDCYVYSRNIEARLDKLACLHSLRICFSAIKGHKGWTNEDLGSNPFQDVLKIISTNKGLKHLHLNFKRGSRPSIPPAYSEMKDRLLEVLGPIVPDLKSLVLEGDLHFTSKALEMWSKPFNQLRSLHIMGDTLIEEMTTSLQSQMPALRTLKLSAHPDLQRSATFQGDAVSGMAFFSTLTLSSLSIFGSTPDILYHAIHFSGPSLLHLCFHVRSDATEWHVFGGPPLSTLMLSIAHLETLKSTCPALQSLSFDITTSSLLAAEKPPPEFPRPDLPPPPFATPSTPTFQVDHSLLFPLAAMPALQQIRLLVHDEELAVRTNHKNPPMSAADVLATYAHLRSHKRGRPLKTLLVCCRTWSFEVWESGPDRVVTVECYNWNLRVREAWDIDEWIMRGREEAYEEDGYTPRHLWGLTEGWS